MHGCPARAAPRVPEREGRVVIRRAPDFAGDELRALDHVLRRMERLAFLDVDPRREHALRRTWSTRAPWDLLTASAFATRASARLLRVASSATRDRWREDATLGAGPSVRRRTCKPLH